MLIDNFSAELLAFLVCPVSRETLSTDGAHLYTESGYTYPHGDFRVVSSSTQAREWKRGQAHYEEHIRRWMARSDDFYRNVDAETEDVYREFPLRGYVLDVGGGYGLVTIQASLDPKQIICVDPVVCCWSDVADGAFKAHYARAAGVIRIPGFAEDLPFRNGSFDTVHMRSCLDHFANPHRALLEARRVLRADGQLVVGLALEGALRLDRPRLVNFAKRKVKNSLLGKAYESIFDHHMFHPTEDSLRALLVSAGFRIDRWIFQRGYSNVVYLGATKSTER